MSLTIGVTRNPVLGSIAAGTVTLIWATWLVASRSGAQTDLTIYDLAALRFGVSAMIALPVVLYYKPWKSMSLARMAVVTFLLGPIYILFVFGGFTYAPAAHGGIFMNGTLPALTLLIGWLWLSEKPHALQWTGVVLIITGACLAAADSSELTLGSSWLGDLMFLIAAVFFSGYLVAGRLWHISTTEVLLCSSVFNAVLYVPIWFFLLPSGIQQVSEAQLILQILYQGLIPGLVGLLLVAYAIRNIGSAMTASFMAAVPALATVLSMIFLGEMPGIIGWLSLLVLTPGILLVALIKQQQ